MYLNGIIASTVISFPSINLTFVFALVTAVCFGQNLIQNPSFESVIETNCKWCDSNNRISSFVNNWESPNPGSPDVHSTLVNDSCWSYASGSNYSDTISCQPGSQPPRTGDVMAGLITYRGESEWREYLQNKLFKPMIPGKFYDVSFYISFADNSRFASNGVGIHFSKNELNSEIIGPLPASPQIEWNHIFEDSDNWVKLDTVILATDSWQYFTLGNFKGNEETIVSETEGCKWAYYYIDDVTVELSENQNEIPTVITPNDDGINDTFSPILLNPAKVSTRIYNRWGRMVYSSNDLYVEWNGKNNIDNTVSSGTYYWLIDYTDITGFNQQLKGSVIISH